MSRGIHADTAARGGPVGNQLWQGCFALLLLFGSWLLPSSALAQIVDVPSSLPSSSLPSNDSSEAVDSDSIKIRRLYVPEDRLSEFMRGRQTYLPLSAAKFQDMLAGTKRDQAAVVTAHPLRHWIVTSPGGSVQGYSLIRGRSLSNGTPDIDSASRAWLSFDEWKIPAEYFNLVPASLPSIDLTEETLNSSGRFELGGPFAEVPVTMSVNEQGLFGLPLAQAEEFMLVRYNLTLATQGETNLYRQLRLPNTPSTITRLRNRANAAQSFHVHGTSLPVNRPLSLIESTDSQRFEYFQVISDAPQLIGQFNSSDRSVGLAPLQGRYIEHSTVSIRQSVIHYETLVTLEFRETIRGDLSLEIPVGLDLTSCEVNGQVQPLTVSSTRDGVRRLKLPWQSWGVNNRVKVTGTFSPMSGGRVSVPRIALPGHVWLLGNVHVNVEPPLVLRDYELINSRVIHCQELGQAQSLTFHWGGPESHVTLLVDASSSDATSTRPKSPDIVLMTADQENLEADQYLLLDNRFRDSNVFEWEVADAWQVEQVAVVDHLQLLETSAERVPESSMTPLQWTSGLQGDRRTILVTLPTDAKQGSLAVRVRAVRPVNQWPLDIHCQIVTGVSEANEARRPCLVSLRGTAGIQAGGGDSSAWTVLTNEEARRQVAELRGVLGAGGFRYSDNPGRLTLQNSADLTGSYDVLAYTRNQVEAMGTVQQWHRLLIQPSGPVYEIELASSRSSQLAGGWRVQDELGKTIPFEVERSGENDGWRIRFPKPLSDSVSILVHQEWVPESEGPMMLYFAPKARSFAGVVDTWAPSTRVFRVESAPTDLAERARLLGDFRMASRRLFASLASKSLEAGNLAESADATAAPKTEGALGDTGNFQTLSVYQHPRDVRFHQSSERVTWSSAMVTHATQFDTWQRDGWATRLSLQVFSEGDDTLTFELPPDSPWTMVQVDQLVVAPHQTGNKIAIPLSGKGSQTVQIHWFQRHRARVSMGSGLAATPARCHLLQTNPLFQRFVCLPKGFSLTETPNELELVQFIVGRRLVSPLVWSVGWSNVADADRTPVDGWSRVPSPLGRDLELDRWWRQDLPLDPSRTVASDRVWVLDQRLFSAYQWTVLLLGSLIAVGLEGARRRWKKRGLVDSRWGVGGGCLAMAMLLPWPYYFGASTLLLGFMIGCSWCDLWRVLMWKPVIDQERVDARSPSRSSRSNSGIRALPSSLWFWGLWLGCYASLWVARESNAASAVHSQIEIGGRAEVDFLKFQQEPSLAPDTTRNENRPQYETVVIPLDAQQKPSDKVVYLSPELYARLTNLSLVTSSIRDLEIRNAQHTLEYDSQLQRFSRLTTQYACKTQAEKMYLLPATANVNHVVRQVRVNGIPVLYQRRGSQIEVGLDAGTSLLSISYDLQSSGSAMELSTLGASDSYVVLNGLPNGWQAMVADHDNPNVRFRSPIQRRFRVDRIKRLMVEVQREAIDLAPASAETWLNIHPQRMQCEVRMTAGSWAKIHPEWLFQVDSRMTLPTSFQPDSPTWTLDTLPDEEKPREARMGPVYRIRFAENHSPNQTIRIPWEFAGRSFGGVLAPQIEFLKAGDLRIRKWIVVRVADGLVYRPVDLTLTNFRRGSTFELPAVSENGNLRGASASPSNEGSTLGAADRLTPAVSDTFVYEELSNPSEYSQSVLGRLSLQPTQATGSLRQNIDLNERSASIGLQGEIQVTQGELSQLPIRLPTGARIQRLAISTAAQSEVAWTVKQSFATHDQVVVLLRNPISGAFRLELAAVVDLPIRPVSPLPWARVLTPVDVSQSLQVRDLVAGWQLRSRPSTDDPSAELSLVEPRSFVVSSDSTDEIDGLELLRQQIASRGVAEPGPNRQERSLENLPPGEDTGEPSTANLAGAAGTSDRLSIGESESTGAAVEMVGSRLVLTKIEQELDGGEKSLATAGRRFEAVQQLLLRNRQNNLVTLHVPVGVEVRRCWVDRRPADAWRTTVESEGGASREHVRGDLVDLAVDPLEEFTLVTLQLSLTFGATDSEIGLVEVASLGPVPVQIEAAPELAWPDELEIAPLSAANAEVNVREVFGRQIANWASGDWASSLPTDHPLLTIAQKPWSEAGGLANFGGGLRRVAILEPRPERLNFRPRWDWGLILGGMAVAWLLGVIWQNRLPAPLVWGDFGWLILAGGTWIGGGEVWFAVLLLTLGGSFLVIRALRVGFSFRFA